MKIFSNTIVAQDGTPVFALYLDTERTGDQQRDCLYAANDFTSMKGEDDAEKILNFLIPLLSELVYTAYGHRVDTQPMTDYHATGFDKNYPNGVKV